MQKEMIVAATKSRGIAPLSKAASKAHSTQIKARKAASKANHSSGVKSK